MKGKNAAYPKAIDEIKAEKELSKGVELWQNKYLNNIVEQDHQLDITDIVAYIASPRSGYVKTRLTQVICR